MSLWGVVDIEVCICCGRLILISVVMANNEQ